MNEQKQIIRIQHGSHLYGTNTESSDLDFKGVFLPSGRDLLLGTVPKVVDRRIKLSSGLKNEAGDVDDQSYSLQKFIKMVASGDTVGTEILFAPVSAVQEIDADIWSEVIRNRDAFLNKQCKGFVGYCQRQAAKYGIKGSRMAACKGIVELLESILARKGITSQTKLADISVELEVFVANHEFSFLMPIAGGAGDPIMHLEVVDRKVPYTGTIKSAYDIYAKVYANYGARTRQAMDNEGIDWKAVSHAVRVSRQAIELLTSRFITFPRPDAEQLLAIKQGKLDYNVVAPMLEGLVEEVDLASKASSLPGKSDEKVIEDLLLKFHLQQVS